MLLSSLFNRHSLEFSGFSDTPVIHANDWRVLLLLALLVLLAIIVATSRGKVLQIIKALVVPRYFSLLQREGKILEQRIFHVMLIFNMTVFALGITTLVELYKPELINQFTYLGCYGLSLLLLTTIFFVKLLLQNLYIYLFDHQRDKLALHQHKFIFTTFAALTLYLALALVMLAGLKQAIPVYIVVFLILVCIFFYNSYKINPKRYNLFQFFIYFCTLEILPYVILVKFMLTI